MNGAASKFKGLEDIRDMNYVTKNSSSFVAFFFYERRLSLSSLGLQFFKN